MKRSMKMRSYLRVSALLTLVVLLLTSVVLMYRSATRNIEESTYFARETVTNYAANQINRVLSDVERLCNYMQVKQDLHNNIDIVTLSESASQRATAHQNVRSVVGVLQASNDFVSDIIVTLPAAEFKSGELHHRETNRFGYIYDTNFVTQAETVFHAPSRLTTSYASRVAVSDCPYYSFSFVTSGGTPVDVCIVLYPEIFLDALEADPMLVLVDAEGTVLAASGETTEAGGERLFDAQSLQQSNLRAAIMSSDWSVVYCPDQTVSISIYLLLFTALLFFLCSIFLCGLISRVYAKEIETPIANLISSVNKMPEDLTRIGPLQHKRFSLREKMFVFLLFTVVFPTMCFIVTFHIFCDDIENRHQTSSYSLVAGSVEASVNALLDRKILVRNHIIYDPLITKTYQLDRNQEEIASMLRENVFLGLDNDHIELYDADGRLLFSNVIISPDRIDVSQFGGSEVWTVEKDPSGNLRFCLFSKLSRLNNYGYCKLSIAMHQIEDLIKKINPHILFDILSESGEVIYSNIDASVAFDRDNAYRWQITNTPWSMDIYFPSESNVSSVALLFLLIAILLFLIVFLVSFPLSRALGKICFAMLDYQVGNPNLLLSENFYVDELNDIARHFNFMSERIENLIDALLISNKERIKIETQRNRAEIAALQMQINPHFLSNTIETIISSMENGQTRQAQQMLKNLNNLFRYGISRTAYEITVRDEITYAKSYADIMQMRYTELRFEWDVEESVLDCVTIKLILQPLIENAIYHGIRKKDDLGLIRIRAFRDADQLVFRVEDDGFGIDAQRLQEVQTYIRDSAAADRIGISNVAQRIWMTYGEKSSVEIDSTLGKGTVVQLRIPYVQSIGVLP